MNLLVWAFMIIIISAIVKVTAKGLNWVRFILILILIFACISFFQYEPNINESLSLWHSAIKYNHVLTFIGMGTILLNILFFFNNSKVAYLIGVCLYFLNFVLYFGAPIDINSQSPRLVGLTIILYMLGVLLIIMFGIKANPSLMQTKKLQLITKVPKLTAEYLYLYIPMICGGILCLIAGIFYLDQDFNENFWLGICITGSGLFFIISSVLSLIPKKSLSR